MSTITNVGVSAGSDGFGRVGMTCDGPGGRSTHAPTIAAIAVAIATRTTSRENPRFERLSLIMVCIRFWGAMLGFTKCEINDYAHFRIPYLSTHPDHD